MYRLLLTGFLLACCATVTHADDDIQGKFNRKYDTFLSQGSQSLLPLPRIDKADWKKMLESQSMKPVYSEPDRFYNNKTYTFTMYRDLGNGLYYLDAKGGFWGMDELIYGPMDGRDWD